MKVTAVKTRKILPGDNDLFSLLSESLPKLKEDSVLVVTSKIVSITEGRTVPVDSVDKEDLIREEADMYHFTEPIEGAYQHHFTIVNETLIPASGIDESNSGGHYVLWPKDPQGTAIKIRSFLKKKYGLKNIGVILTDSTIFLSRWGTMGITIGYSGFKPLKDYIGSKDLFGRELKVSTSNVAGGLAAAAVIVMGEGKERTPLAVIEDAPFVEFVDHNPTKEELNNYYISPLRDDPFARFFNSTKWHKGGKK